MPYWLMGWFNHYGYAVLVVAVVLENIGIPAPGQTALLAAGFLAHRHQLALPWVIVTAAVSAVLGDNLGFWLGRRGGRRWLERHARLFRMTPERREKVERFFARHGPKTVFIARFVSGIQTFAAVAAGLSGMPWRTFLLYNITGAITWAVTISLTGYFFGESWNLLDRWVGHAGLFLLGIVLASMMLVWAKRYGRQWTVRLGEYLPEALVSRTVLLAMGALGAIGVFAKIADDVMEHETSAFDRTASLALHRLDSPVMDVLMRGFSFLGSFPVVLAVVILTVILCFRGGARGAAYTVLAVSIATEALNLILKQAFERPRPSLFTEIATLHSYSFPSGHAMSAAAIYGIVTAVLARFWPRRARPVLITVPILVLMIGLSRIFLGVHWVTDVLAGFAAGLFLLLGGLYFLGGGAGTTAP
jgi:membrane protein DedA with SNARE-associated domain/membrane-associated phospholipid phosphatase